MPGAYNMAVDEALLLDAAENGIATLRFYGWSEPTLSLGYFQRYEDRNNHPASLECAIVRRQTGGGAILHDRELTYSLTLPPDCPIAKCADRLYRTVHQEFVDALSLMTRSVQCPWRLDLRGPSGQQDADEPFLCFQRRSLGDVVITKIIDPERDGIFSHATCRDEPRKILGSAQRRLRGAVLQHGSLLLKRSRAAPELSGLCDLNDLNVVAAEVATAVSSRLGNVLDMTFLEASLPPELQSKAAELTNNKYGSPTWTKRR
jgi:lipoate-protein ligase A